jgi:hypothetical protein
MISPKFPEQLRLGFVKTKQSNPKEAVMVETRERDVVYTTDAGDGPSAALVVLFSVLIVAVLGFMVYYFSNNNLRTEAPTTIIERNTNTTIPVPTPTAPSAPAMPDINITPPATPDTSSTTPSTP